MTKQRTSDRGRAKVERLSASVSEVLGSSGVRAISRGTECVRTDLFIEGDN